MKRYLPVILTAFSILLNCAGSRPCIPPHSHEIVPAETDSTPEVGDTQGSEETQKRPVGYDGHGAASVSAELLATYAPPGLPGAVSRRIQSMMDVTSPSPGLIAPDGKTLIFNWSITGVSQIWKLSEPMGFPRQLSGGEDSTRALAIMPNGKQIIVSRDRRGEENPGLYLQSINGGQLEKIQHVEGARTFFEWVSDDSKYLYFRSNDIKENAYAIYRYDVSTREKLKIFDQDGLWDIADVRDEKNLLLQKHVGNLYSEIFELNISTKQLTPLFGQNEMEEYKVRYGSKDGEILVLTNKFEEFRRLYSWREDKFTPITGELNHDIADFGIDRVKKKLLYQVNRGGYFTFVALNGHSYKPIRLPKIPNADHVYGGSTSYDGRYSVIAIDDGKKPLRSFVIDWRKNKITAWHEPSTPEIDTTQFVRAQLEHYQAQDGTKIPVWVRQSEKCKAKLCPVIVYFHGGPEAQTLPGFSWRSQLFVDGGFVFVSPNVRGSDGYGKKWLHADNGPKRADIITDIEDASRWAKKRFAVGVKSPKLGIYGGSYGGYSVLVGMTIFSGSYDVGVQIVGISNLVTFLENTAPYRRILRATEYGDPVKDREALLELSPTTHIDKLNAPILNIQGATDPRVPVGEAIQIHQGLVERGVDSTLIIFPDEGHGARKRSNRVLMYGHSLKFFEKHLLGKE